MHPAAVGEGQPGEPPATTDDTVDPAAATGPTATPPAAAPIAEGSLNPAEQLRPPRDGFGGPSLPDGSELADWHKGTTDTIDKLCRVILGLPSQAELRRLPREQQNVLLGAASQKFPRFMAEKLTEEQLGQFFFTYLTERYRCPDKPEPTTLPDGVQSAALPVIEILYTTVGGGASYHRYTSSF